MTTIQCRICGQPFNGKSKNQTLCSRKCSGISRTKSVTLVCTQCGIPFTKTKSQCRKTLLHFCSLSCAATYHNNHKTSGIHRSKFEVWIYNQLSSFYPEFEFLHNDSTIIGLELDIFIPKLGIAFEFNGIHHYKPIHGINKLLQIQKNDNIKALLCKQQHIVLYTFDISNIRKFKPITAIPFLVQTKHIITLKLESGGASRYRSEFLPSSAVCNDLTCSSTINDNLG